MTGLHGHELGTPPPLNEQELTARLARNREAIRNGTALFNGLSITYETELTRYEQESARRHMAEHGFPTGSVIRVDVTGKLRPRRYEISYDDLPITEGRDWIGQSHGVSILVSKKDAPRLEGLTIDFQDGRYTFDESTLTSLD